ncbi:ribosomal protein S18 acetylase RimI-like enzyme [Allocatelliglobosispora scoriae]|uniref:Ribosomal protein S18 acetylase RimI-like enzyme n=1 Tax=Allocatelliglobosispora scoriae TaxID=643052 RepID=A0A841C274_9ACTN|nr:N-acetyltransferase [Allocatelliglobosispora scoriae]MBB5873070.1 ribosomal protein S18 acetylase RimI-like enzyme [Allocatelliglobosispora scoriae]
MIGPTPYLHGRAELLDATDRHPYALLTSSGGQVTAWRAGDGLVWRAVGPWGPIIASLGGEAGPVAMLIAQLDHVGLLDGIRWMHLPRSPRAQLAATLTVLEQDDWDFLWTADEPPPHPGEADVVALTEADHDEILAVIADALPHSTSRPGDPRIRTWHGIRHGGRLVAVAGDRSVDMIGHISAIAVASDRQGGGFGAALTSALTRRLIAEFGMASLGVMSDNDGALRFYRRLGYAGELTRSSIRIS